MSNTKSIQVLNEEHVLATDFAERFWRNVSKPEDPSACWTWLAASNHSGYGAVTVLRTMQLAHRVAWRMHNGPIPPGMVVMHTCDNPPCCRPDHLTLGSPADNARDAVAKGHMGGGYRRENTTKWSSPKQSERRRPTQAFTLSRELHRRLDELKAEGVNLSALAEEALRAHPKLTAELQQEEP